MARFGRRQIFPWFMRRPPVVSGLTSGAIAGTCSLAFDNSGTIGAGGAMVGSCALAIANAGTLAGSGALLGSCDVVISNTGSLTGGDLIAGTAALTITPSGTLVGEGALAGSCVMVLSAEANSGAVAPGLPPNLWFTLGKERTEYTLPKSPEFTTEHA